MNFTAMDLGTIDHQPYNARPLMLVMIENSQIADGFYTLIQPETPFFWRNVQIHGTHQEGVHNTSKFPEVWQAIQLYFQKNLLVIAHDTTLDTKVLTGCLGYYHPEWPDYFSLCTVKSSRRLFSEFPDHRLNTVYENLDVQLDHHHDTLEGGRACTEILFYQEKKFGTDPLKKLVTIE